VYESHYGLVRRPFGESIDPSRYVPLPSHEALLRRLRYALEHSGGPALLHGPGGSGKSLIARRLASELGTAAIHVPFPALPAADLLGLLADALGEPTEPTSTPGEALRRVRNGLAALARQGRRPLLIVDDAQTIRDPATFESLRLLLNFVTDGTPDLLLLLVGTTEVLDELSPALADRLAARCLAGPLTASESSGYLLGRLAAASATPGRPSPFSTEAVALLHYHAGGLPRRLNRLADLALLIGYAQDLPLIDAPTIATAAREFDHDGLAA
jgi:type II secretory pathway predicted ATPase ExeA